MAKTSDCPICGADARLTEDRRKGPKFDCPDCGVFRVSVDLLENIARHSRDARKLLLSEAKRRAKPGTLPFVQE